MMGKPLRLLTIAGSDSSGGAGLQADLKTFAAHGAYGMSAVTAVTAQSTCEVLSVFALPASLVALQIDAVLSDVGADAVKIGMLADAAIVRAVAERLRAHFGPGGGSGSARRVPIVLDPVLRSTSGTPLLAEAAVAALVGELLPLVTLVTPNLPELERLTGRRLDGAGEEERRRAAAALAESGPAVLAKGGHAEGPEVVDLLVTHEATHRFAHARLATAAASARGTGCTLSAAIAAHLGAGEELAAAVEGGIGYLRGVLAVTQAPSRVDQAARVVEEQRLPLQRWRKK
jgi:hydroxymethylpyrimidine/phosphomethylpyrimidine kinase